MQCLRVFSITSPSKFLRLPWNEQGQRHDQLSWFADYPQSLPSLQPELWEFPGAVYIAENGTPHKDMGTINPRRHQSLKQFVLDQGVYWKATASGMFKISKACRLAR